MANCLYYLIADDMSLWRAGVHLPSILIRLCFMHEESQALASKCKGMHIL